MSVGKPSVAIVGAGLAGLTAAFRLQQSGWDVHVFEASDRAGGRVQTVALDGFVIDTGASAVAESYKAYFELLEDLGLKGELEACSPWIGIVREDQVHLLRLDRVVTSGVTSNLLSWRAKFRLLRLGADILSAKRRGALDYSDMRRAASIDNETARHYAQRALSEEVDRYLRSPIIRTMLISDDESVSKVEFLSGIANIFSARLYALKGGQQLLPIRLAEKVSPRLRCEVTNVLDDDAGVELELCTAEVPSRSVRFDACVVCCELPAAERICKNYGPLLRPLNEALKYTESITVAVGTRVTPRSPAMLIQLPACEESKVALMFLEHNKAQDRAPRGKGLIGCQWEAHASSTMMRQSDAAIVEHTLHALYRVFPETRGSVEFTHVTRWSLALPLTAVGTYKKIGEFVSRMHECRRVQFASDYMGEAGQNTAVRLGNEAASRLEAARKSGALTLGESSNSQTPLRIPEHIND